MLEVRSKKMKNRVSNLLLPILIFNLLFLLVGSCSVAGATAKTNTIPDGMVYIPEGYFLMGSTEKDGRVGSSIGVDELPQHKVYVKGFYMDRFEGTVLDFRRFLIETGRQAPRIWVEDEWIKMYPAPVDNHPMNGVSWYDAEAYCKWQGKRLPTEAEWEKAARSTDGRQWPWGNELNVLGKIKANTQEAGIGWTTPVDSYPEGVSPYGVYNMTGNVMEWTSDWYNAYPGSTLQREAFGEKYKVLKGGAWENPNVPIGRSAYRLAVTPIWDHPGHGIRCAKDMK